MKLFTCLMVITVSFLTGCADEAKIANPPLTKGFIAEKRYIPATSLPVEQALRVSGNSSQIMITAPEMFIIALRVKTDRGRGYSINNYTFYQVSPVTFGELSVGQEVDTKNNEAFKIVEVR